VNRFVLDASVGLAWFIDKPQPTYAAEIRKRLALGVRAVVPSLWHLEIANGFALAERRGAFTPAETEQHLIDVEALLSTCIETQVELRPLRETVSTAITMRLSAYDALYLDTARHLALPLATLDRDLRVAAARVGVPLVP
jgi:predicted nucleic acid-binding protein